MTSAANRQNLQFRRVLSVRCYCSGMRGRYSVAVSGAALVDALDLDGAEPGFEWSPAYSVALVRASLSSGIA